MAAAFGTVDDSLVGFPIGEQPLPSQSAQMQSQTQAHVLESLEDLARACI